MSTADRVLDKLQAGYKLKAEGPGKYRCNSPLRPNADSHSFTLTIEDDEHGAFYDHTTGEGGSLYDLADALGIERPQGATAPEAPGTKIAYTDLNAYAQAHGVAGDVFKAAGWGERITYQNRPALPFTTTTGTRYRFIDGAPKPKPTYMSPSGYQRCWYGLEYAVLLATTTEQPLVICNGEASTVVAQHYGVAATAITAGEGNGLPDGLRHELQAVYRGPILITFDCDPTGRTGAAKLMAPLTSAGYDVRALDLNGGVKGFDLADFCRLHATGTSAALPLLQDVATLPQADTAPHRPRLLHADELDKLPPPTWLVQDEIPASGLTVLFGLSGGGKSFVALDYALRVAQEHNVVYIAAEGASGYAARKNAWCQHTGKTAGGLHFWLDAVHMLQHVDVETFISEIAPLNPKLVVVDTLARCLVGGDENTAKDMGIFVAACATIQRALGTAVLAVHHTGKNGQGERGSSALRGASDAMIDLSNDDGLITVACSKMKDAEGFQPHYYRLIEVGDSCVLAPADRVLQLPGTRLTARQRKVLEVLNQAVFQDIGAKATVLADATGIPLPTLYRMLSAMMNLGYITRGAKGDPYTITDDGRDMVEKPVPTITPSAHSTAQLSPTITNSQQLSDRSTINYHNYHTPLGVIVDDSSLPVEREREHIPAPQQTPDLPPALGGDYDYDALRRQEAGAALARGDIKQARKIADQVRGRKDRLALYTEIEQAVGATSV